MIEKWYRGHEGNKKATDNFGIIWLADDPDYAQEYANEYPDGVVSTVFIDMNKINELEWYYDEDFDPYDPDMRLVKEYMKEQGGNAYTFGVNDGTTVLALLSTEPIVKVEKTIIENKKYRNMKIKLTESKLKQIVAESVKKALRESDEFKPHGYKGTSNWGGNEIQLSDRGDEARIRDSHTGKISNWMEIQFDENGVAYVTDENGNKERLCDYLRY